MLTTLLQKNHVIIGKKLAEQWGVTVGDTITLLYTSDEMSGKKIMLQQAPALISGLFHAGIEEFDAGMIICSLTFLHTLFPETGITQLGIVLKPETTEPSVIAALSKRLKLEVYSWKELYPALLAALKLEKYAMFFILVLITLVASMNIVSLLFMFITQKKGSIAILKANGCTTFDIQSIFLIITLGLATSATLAGLACAYAVGWILQTYPFITLPDVYYVSHLPIHMEFKLFVLVFIVVILLCFLATFIPLRATKKISIAHVLRNEA